MYDFLVYAYCRSAMVDFAFFSIGRSSFMQQYFIKKNTEPSERIESKLLSFSPHHEMCTMLREILEIGYTLASEIAGICFWQILIK